MRDLSSNQINFERERDPVGEKTTKIGGGPFALQGLSKKHVERLKLTNKIDSTLSRPFERTNP